MAKLDNLFVRKVDLIDYILQQECACTPRITGEMALRQLREWIKYQPSAVITCENCKYSHLTYDGECKYCDQWDTGEKLYLDGEFYCAYAERREDETD